MSFLLIFCSLILCSVFCENAENLEYPVSVTSARCSVQSQSPSTITGNLNSGFVVYDETISWSSNSRDKLFLTYMDSKCVRPGNWCQGSCSNLRSSQITGRERSTRSYVARQQEYQFGFSHIALIHTDDNICTWAKRYDTSLFKSTKTIACPSFIDRRPTTDEPTDTPSYRPDYSLVSLLLLVLPILIILLIIKKVIDAYRNRVAANEQLREQRVTETNMNNNINNVPLYDMNTLPYNPNTQVQIFPEYPMMNSTNNQFQGDPIQTLTPVYTQTYSYPGVQ